MFDRDSIISILNSMTLIKNSVCVRVDENGSITVMSEDLGNRKNRCEDCS